ncbi:uncharacterized protein LOC110684142 isoform X2 [Chenopodium quinoa]|uniref:uncharacterized protein LOC110684142 isoform X2 n=1 Tax=Chenopodium quinoa TaxID=63459 RepID=UPI000B7743A7|nr:uncharacterized protein LOC110684142 isoform X2 [Chenopodium quinoa]
MSVETSAQASALNSGNPILKTYDLIAVRPLNQNSFDIACQSSQVDLITIDFAEKLPFRLKLPMVIAAIARGVYFEIMYSSLMQDVQLRRQLISNAKLLVEWTQGKNLIVSSAAPSVLELRGPNDVTNLLSLLGLSNECAKATISKNCRTKQFYKEAMRVDLMQPGVQTGPKEPWIVDHIDWDPISSGEGDLFLDDMEKAIAESGKTSKTIKGIDSSSIDVHMSSHDLKLNDTSFREEGKQCMSSNFTEFKSTSKDLEVLKKIEKLQSEPTSMCSMDQQGNAAENNNQAVLLESLLACNNDEDDSIYSAIALQELKSSDALETTTSPFLHKLAPQDHVNNAENVLSDSLKEITSKDDGLDVGCIAGSRKEALVKSEGLNCNGLQTDKLKLASDVLNSTDAEISTEMLSFDQSYISYISNSSLDGKPLEPQEDSVADKNSTLPARNVMDLDSFSERNSSDYLLHCDQQPLDEVEEIEEHKGDHTEVKTDSKEFIVADTMLPLDPHQHEKNGNDLLVAKSMFSDDMMKCRKHVQEVGEADHQYLGKNKLGNHKVKRRDTGKAIRFPFKRLFQVQFKKRNSFLKTRKRE